MEALITWLLTNFTFFASGLGILTIGAIAVLMIFLWEWRSSLVALCVIQLGVAVLVTQVRRARFALLCPINGLAPGLCDW